MTAQPHTPAASDFPHLKHNYSEAALSYRHFSGLRFVIMSVYVALVGALTGVALGVVGSTTPSVSVTRIATAAGLLVTICFFVCEIACDRSRKHFIYAMRALEPQLGYTTMTTFPLNARLKASHAFKLLYATNLAFWMWRLISY